MLKFIFWSLLVFNGALYAYGQGYLGDFRGNEREPARLKNQLNAAKLTLIAGAQANAAAPAVAAAANAKPAPAPLACIEIGNFLLADARRFEARLAPLELGDRQARRNVPGQEVSGYIVHIPPNGGKEGADRRVAELKQLGVSSYFIMSDSPTLRWGISLGVFKTEPAAQSLLAALNKQGVNSARIAPRMSGSKQLVFQLRDIDAGVKAELDKIMAGFPNQESRSCK